MAVFGPVTQAIVTQQVQAKLTALQDALNAVTSLYQWSSGVSAADLEALGFSAADAGAILSAVADAHAVAQIYVTGLPPSTYPQPASAYVYEASQARVIGPAG